MSKCDVRHLSNIEGLRTLADNSIHSVVTDPPYGLSKQTSGDVVDCLTAWVAGKEYRPNKRGFMGKEWDGWVPGPGVWREVYRVLKPGGYCAVFAGSRTVDLMGISLRLAGLEFVDTVMWTYAQGFPKSYSVGKGIDKAAGKEREVVGSKLGLPGYRSGDQIPSTSLSGGVDGKLNNGSAKLDITAPVTDDAKKWEGYGTALKPSLEPVLIFRKPLDGTIVENVLEHGTGAMNIDACRVSTTDALSTHSRGKGYDGYAYGHNNPMPTRIQPGQQIGRWPANFILSHTESCRSTGTKSVKNSSGSVAGTEPSHTGDENTSCYGEYDRVALQAYGDAEGNEVVEAWECSEDCPVKLLDEQSGECKGSPASWTRGAAPQFQGIFGEARGHEEMVGYGDAGTASRFFYTAKSSKKDRHLCSDGVVRRGIDNRHPTVKPTEIMRWLVKLVTPQGGTVLDPFVGSGTTAVSAALEGFDVIGFERDADSALTARRRCGLEPVSAEPEIADAPNELPVAPPPIKKPAPSLLDVMLPDSK